MSRKTSFVAVLLALWLTGTVAGMSKLWRYSLTAGNLANIASNWPASSAIQRLPGNVSLVMLVHPQCPCSAASVEELNRIMAKFPRLSAYVLFYKPVSSPAGWEQGALWRSTREIPGVRVLTDINGVQAQLFGAQTSGQTMLYDGEGRLIFSGGITAARGHAGDNDGQEMILSYLENGTPPRAHSPVYGCSILDRRSVREVQESADASKSL